MKTLILTAGKIDYTRLPFGMHQSNATIPVNGKPVISWILDDLIKKGISEIYIVIRAENNRLHELLEKHYSKRIDIHIVVLVNPASILHSLHGGLAEIGPTEDSLQVILGDTLIYDSFENIKDCMYTAQVTNSENWCIAQTDFNGNLNNLVDKQEIPGDHYHALCGYYCFNSVVSLSDAVNLSLQQGAKELSDTLLKYHKKHPLKLIQAENWFDFGHLESFIQSKKSLLRPRHFNQLTIDPLLNTITKVSEKSDKLTDELNWYKLLPEDLKTLTPRIISSQNNQQIAITQEFYGYPALSELFVYGDLSASVWESIIEYLFQIHGLLKNFQKPAVKEYLSDIYQTKTSERVVQLIAQDPQWENLWKQETIKINGIRYKNISECLEHLKEKMEALNNATNFQIIHGDYCLSNILYDLNNQIVRLIDPRGSFGVKGIYGDGRYDIAKLRHSIVGLYDYIVGDLFLISNKDNIFEYTLFEDTKNKHLAEYMDKCIVQNNYNLNEIKLIEGLLFLSMIPYHADYKERQLMMYVKSVIILNELIK